ncbi:MAG: efflux RND transporter permease subunit [Chloroflexaceae bacterium]|nr:efflux RND transporter permease subunit [Chloroflexaceae bacterium]
MATGPSQKEKLNGLWISDMSIRQPVFITMIMLAVLTFGILAFRTTPVNLLPDIDVPVMAVSITYPGAGPESVADQVVKPIEDAVNTLGGLEDITSQASEGFALILLEFRAGTDIREAEQQVREKVNAVLPTLPRDVRQPVYERFDPNQEPIMSIAVAGTAGQSPLELRRILDDEIVPLLQRAQGVGSISVSGGETRQINVLMDLEKLQAYGILPSQISNSLRQANANLGLGSITQGDQEISLRAPSLLQTPEDIARIQITGTPYRVGDVARVEDGVADVTRISRLNGSEAIILQVRKQSGANTVAVADNVQKALAEVFANRPDLTYTIPRDDSEAVRSSVASSLEELIFASIAAFAVVWLFFRNLRSTIITMSGLPIILIGTFIFMPFFGLTINLITLLALSLCVGLVIDDAIVVRENIFRHMERGESARVAASRGTWEVGLSVVAMTLTIVAVFVPVTFAEGTAGIVFKSFGLVVSIAILLSLAEAFTLAPMMSANVFPGVKVKPHQEKGPHHDAVPGLKLDHLEGEHIERDAGLIHEAQEDPGRMGLAYGSLLAWTLRSTRNRLIVVGIAIGVLVLSMVVASGLKFSFFPEQDPHQFLMGFESPPGTALEQTNRLAQQAEQVLLADPAVETVIANVGFAGNPERAEFFVKLKGRTPTVPVQERLRDQLAFLPRLSFAQPSFQPTSTGVAGRELQVSLQTARPVAELEPVVQAVMAELQRTPGLVDVDTNFQFGKPELRFRADPGRIGELGVTNDDIATSVRALINGDRATVLRQNGADTDVVVRLEPEDRSGVEALGAISIPTRTGNVPLSALGTVELASSPVTIRRFDRLNQVLVGANLEGRNLGEVQAEIAPRIAALGIPGDVVVSYVGTLQQTSEGFESLLLAMGLSVLFVYMVLASQFGSFSQPLVIMMAMPFSFIGAFLVLRIIGIDLDITGMIGLIMLLGLVVKNSILLVDFTNRLRELGLSKHEALRLAGAIRLRPILMTALSLIAGALPTALGIHLVATGEGSEFRKGLAWVIIGGMTTSTLLTLLVVPTVYSLMDSAVTRFSAWVRRRIPAAAPPAAPAAPAAPAGDPPIPSLPGPAAPTSEPSAD